MKRPDWQPRVCGASLQGELSQIEMETQVLAHQDRRDHAESGKDDTATGRQTATEMQTKRTTATTCGETAVRGDATTEAATVTNTMTVTMVAAAEAATASSVDGTGAGAAEATAAAAAEATAAAAAEAAAGRRGTTDGTTNDGTRRQLIYPELHARKL